MLQAAKMNTGDVMASATCICGLLAMVLCLGPVATAAEQDRVAGRGALVAVFERTAPAVGDLMPDLPVYDRDGQELRLRVVLNGRYTVLVLGCLT